MTRDEHREKCIDTMAAAFFDMQRVLGYAPQRDHPDPRICMTAAFDALHGIAHIVSPEVTEEMEKAGFRAAILDELDMRYTRIRYTRIFAAMAAAGDLTNAPETKPINVVRIDAGALERIEEVNRFIRSLISAAQTVWPDYRARLAVTNPPETKP